MLAKIVSGGQTGVDPGALEAGQWIKFPYVGRVPKGRKTEACSLSSAVEGCDWLQPRTIRDHFPFAILFKMNPER